METQGNFVVVFFVEENGKNLEGIKDDYDYSMGRDSSASNINVSMRYRFHFYPHFITAQCNIASIVCRRKTINKIACWLDHHALSITMWPRVFNKIRPKIFESHDPHLFAVAATVDVVVGGGDGDVIIIIAFLLSFLSQRIK